MPTEAMAPDRFRRRDVSVGTSNTRAETRIHCSIRWIGAMAMSCVAPAAADLNGDHRAIAFAAPSHLRHCMEKKDRRPGGHRVRPKRSVSSGRSYSPSLLDLLSAWCGSCGVGEELVTGAVSAHPSTGVFAEQLGADVRIGIRADAVSSDIDSVGIGGRRRLANWQMQHAT